MYNRILFSNRQTCHPEGTDTSQKLGIADLSGAIRYIDFDKFHVPGATKWSKDSIFSDGNRIIMHCHHFLKPLSSEVSFHDAVRVSIWIYNIESDTITPVEVYGDYDSSHVTNVILLPGEERLAAGLLLKKNNMIDLAWVAMDLDGNNKCELIPAGRGFSHALVISSDGKQMATEFYTDVGGTRISVMNLDGSSKIDFPHRPGDNHFMPQWSPDGTWILYVNYLHDIDPGHERADLCMARPDGSEQRTLTVDRPHWLSATYGGPNTYGSGSNPSHWSPDGSSVVLLRLLPDSQSAWGLNPHPAFDDHFGRIFTPDQARGGTEISLLNPFTGEIRALTHNDPPTWDFRAVWSPDGSKMAFCRAAVGQAAGLWVMNPDGSEQRLLTRGYADKSADHPRWLCSFK